MFQASRVSLSVPDPHCASVGGRRARDLALGVQVSRLLFWEKYADLYLFPSALTPTWPWPTFSFLVMAVLFHLNKMQAQLHGDSRESGKVKSSPALGYSRHIIAVFNPRIWKLGRILNIPSDFPWARKKSMQTDHQQCQRASGGEEDTEVWCGEQGNKTSCPVHTVTVLKPQLQQRSPCLLGCICGGKQIGTGLSQTNKILNCYRNNTLSWKGCPFMLILVYQIRLMLY